MALEVIVLAAGMGKRMHSSLPKVLHAVAAQPMLFHVIKTAATLDPQAIHVVLGHGGDKVEAALQQLSPKLQSLVKVCYQKEQLGTAHAVAQALPQVDASSQVIVLYGDTPLTPKVELERLLAKGDS